MVEFDWKMNSAVTLIQESSMILGQALNQSDHDYPCLLKKGNVKQISQRRTTMKISKTQDRWIPKTTEMFFKDSTNRQELSRGVVYCSVHRLIKIAVLYLLINHCTVFAIQHT